MMSTKNVIFGGSAIIAILLIVYQESFFDSIVDNIVEMWDSG